MMANTFVEYMSSMNNANGDTSNALAEAQVNNEYYKEIKVDRKLGKEIVKDINNGKKCAYIITGHAGDGKTSILTQILLELDALDGSEQLQIKGEVTLSGGSKLLYVKDMSELSIDNQIKSMKEILEAPMNGNIGIMISNTGP